MIWYVVTDSEENYRSSSAFYYHKFALERIAGDCCLILHYRQANHRLFAEHNPWAICHSGGSAIYDDYDIMQTEAYCSSITKWDVPQIGFCGGHQVIASQFGSRIGPMRPLGPNEPDLNPGYWQGQYKEWGMYPVGIVKADPLFDELGSPIRIQEYHSWEVKELGQKLILLASSDNCRVQAFVHSEKPIYGTQFHPEQSNEYYSDGFKILNNFFRIAREYTQK